MKLESFEIDVRALMHDCTNHYLNANVQYFISNFIPSSYYAIYLHIHTNVVLIHM